MAPKKSDSAAASKSKPSHGSYQDMITDAIIMLKDRNGSSRVKLKKYVKANNTINVSSDTMFDSLFNKALKNGVEKGVFEQPKGPSGGTKLAKKAKAPKKEAAPKKAVAPKKKAATTTKKAAAPKKKAEEEKKPAPKKAAATKKATAKTTKAAPKEPIKKTKSGRVAKAPAVTATRRSTGSRPSPRKRS